MKKILLSLFYFIFFSVLVPAQGISDYFISIPDTLLPQLDNGSRKELVDQVNNGKEAQLKNTMGGNSALKELTPDYLFLETTQKSFMELKLLPLINNTSVICMVRTVQGPVADSRVSFYSTDWKELDADALFTPVKRDAFLIENKDNTNEDYQFTLSRLDMDLVKYSLSPTELTLTATYMTPEYLSVSERKKVLPYLKQEPKIFTWKHARFE